MSTDASPPDGPDTDLAADVALLARVLLAPGDLTQVLQRVVSFAVHALDGCDEAGTCSMTVGRDVAAGVNLVPAVARLDQLQTDLGEGPCVDVQTGTPSVYAEDLEGESRWPRFAAAAVEAGLRSVLAYRLFAGSETFGALHLYARRPAAFDTTARAQGLLFAALAGLAIDAALTQSSDKNVKDQLQQALVSREIIGQAQGILMERERISADQAFQVLRHSSQHLNVKLRTVAQDLVDTGLIPTNEAADKPPSGG